MFCLIDLVVTQDGLTQNVTCGFSTAVTVLHYFLKHSLGTWTDRETHAHILFMPW